jgi:hypothetical protein
MKRAEIGPRYGFRQLSSAGSGRFRDADEVAAALASAAARPPREFLSVLAGHVDVRAGSLEQVRQP